MRRERQKKGRTFRYRNFPLGLALPFIVVIHTFAVFGLTICLVGGSKTYVLRHHACNFTLRPEMKQ